MKPHQTAAFALFCLHFCESPIALNLILVLHIVWNGFLCPYLALRFLSAVDTAPLFSDDISGVLSPILLICTFSCALVIAFEGYITNKRIIAVYRDMQAISQSYATFSPGIWLVIGIETITLTVHMVLKLKYWAVNLCLFVMKSIMLVRCLEMQILSKFVDHRLETIIADLADFTRTRRLEHELFAKWARLSAAYSDLWIICQQLNKTFSWSVTVITLQLFIDITCHSYWFLMKDTHYFTALTISNSRSV